MAALFTEQFPKLNALVNTKKINVFMTRGRNVRRKDCDNKKSNVLDGVTKDGGGVGVGEAEVEIMQMLPLLLSLLFLVATATRGFLNPKRGQAIDFPLFTFLKHFAFSSLFSTETVTSSDVVIIVVVLQLVLLDISLLLLLFILFVLEFLVRI